MKWTFDRLRKEWNELFDKVDNWPAFHIEEENLFKIAGWTQYELYKEFDKLDMEHGCNAPRNKKESPL